MYWKEKDSQARYTPGHPQVPVYGRVTPGYQKTGFIIRYSLGETVTQPPHLALRQPGLTQGRPGSE
ncbi:hypothetical protein E2C01_102548 [Portunus trituberculatus]|uniref:Uncharacterized protein n=1 Tax=Portunus trituberculatus TaxID=210409 RepID=A0A5B7KDL3_PORTR|nr:hypothetical protein [Portunus trituberculatus]